MNLLSTPLFHFDFSECDLRALEETLIDAGRRVGRRHSQHLEVRVTNFDGQVHFETHAPHGGINWGLLLGSVRWSQTQKSYVALGSPFLFAEEKSTVENLFREGLAQGQKQYDETVAVLDHIDKLENGAVEVTRYKNGVEAFFYDRTLAEQWCVANSGGVNKWFVGFQTPTENAKVDDLLLEAQLPTPVPGLWMAYVSRIAVIGADGKNWNELVEGGISGSMVQ